MIMCYFLSTYLFQVCIILVFSLPIALYVLKFSKKKKNAMCLFSTSQVFAFLSSNACFIHQNKNIYRLLYIAHSLYFLLLLKSELSVGNEGFFLRGTLFLSQEKIFKKTL